MKSFREKLRATAYFIYEFAKHASRFTDWVWVMFFNEQCFSFPPSLLKFNIHLLSYSITLFSNISCFFIWNNSLLVEWFLINNISNVKVLNVLNGRLYEYTVFLLILKIIQRSSESHDQINNQPLEPIYQSPNIGW